MNGSGRSTGPRTTSAGTRTVAAALGAMVGVSGLDHGFFEMLQGNTATGQLVVRAIGPEQRMWVYGTEEAFTIVPNFLLTGVLSVAVGLAVIVWSIGFIDRPHGAAVFLALAGLMFLVGGGVGMLVFVALGWAVARRIHRPIGWWRRLPAGAVGPLARGWRPLIAVAAVLYAFALEVAIAGAVPGIEDPHARQYLCWLALLGMLASLVLALAGASAREAVDGAGASDDTSSARLASAVSR
jgi:hypothetical protein